MSAGVRQNSSDGDTTPVSGPKRRWCARTPRRFAHTESLRKSAKSWSARAAAPLSPASHPFIYEFIYNSDGLPHGDKPLEEFCLTPDARGRKSFFGKFLFPGHPHPGPLPLARERENRRLPSGKSPRWTGRTRIRKTRIERHLFLLRGEKVRMRASLSQKQICARCPRRTASVGPHSFGAESWSFWLLIRSVKIEPRLDIVPVREAACSLGFL